MNSKPLFGTYWLRATETSVIGWARFYVRGNGTVDVLANTGYASYVDQREMDARQARRIYASLREAGWLKKTDDEAKSAGMDERSLRAIVLD